MKLLSLSFLSLIFITALPTHAASPTPAQGNADGGVLPEPSNVDSKGGAAIDPEFVASVHVDGKTASGERTSKRTIPVVVTFAHDVSDSIDRAKLRTNNAGKTPPRKSDTRTVRFNLTVDPQITTQTEISLTIKEQAFFYTDSDGAPKTNHEIHRTIIFSPGQEQSTGRPRHERPRERRRTPTPQHGDSERGDQ